MWPITSSNDLFTLLSAVGRRCATHSGGSLNYSVKTAPTSTQSTRRCCFVTWFTYLSAIYTINLQDTLTLGGAYNGGGASPVGLQGHVICCSGR